MENMIRIGLILALAALPASAVTIQVNTTQDVVAADGLTSLREAVIWANTNAGLDTIQIPTGHYVLAIAGAEDQALAGDLDFNDHTIVKGAGARNTVIDADGLDRVMFFNQDLEIWMSDVAVVGGVAAGDGGGLYNQATARLVRCELAYNYAYNVGGAIEQYGGALFLDQCAVYYNAAGGSGAGGVDMYSGWCSASNTTFSGNQSYRGGALYRDGGELHLFGCTVVSNNAYLMGGGIFGGLYSLANSLVAYNGAPQGPDLYGGAASQGYNLVGTTAGANGFAPTDLLDVEAKVGGLRYYGGETPTHNLLPGSPALNAADPNYPTNTVPYDQRGKGYRRLRGLGVDIGAYEHQRPDQDLDGMPDEWEQANQLNPTNGLDGAIDDDRDGFSNEQEYQADTDPGDDASFFALTAFARGPGTNQLSFVSSTGRLYQAEVAPVVDQDTWTTFTAWLSPNWRIPIRPPMRCTGCACAPRETPAQGAAGVNVSFNFLKVSRSSGVRTLASGPTVKAR